MLVGEAEQIVGAQARLHVLEGDVVDRLALGERVADVGQHLARGRADVDLAGASTPSAFISARRWPWSRSEVAKPGRV